MVTVRKYKNTDRQEVVDLWSKVFPDNPPHNQPEYTLAEKLKHDDLVFVAIDEGEIVGACMAGYDGTRGWLYSVAVDPSCRKKGIGKKLVETAISSLKELGCIKVNLQIRSGNEEVVEFYKSLGFAVEERISMGRLLDDN